MNTYLNPLNWYLIILTMRSFIRAYSRGKESALSQRFQQILDEQISQLGGSIIDRDPTLKNLYNKYSQDVKGIDLESAARDRCKKADEDFRRKYQKEIGYVESEKLLRTKHAKDLADTITNPPWTGNERPTDAVLRMLVDSTPKAKPVGPKKTIITPPIPVTHRIKNARDSSLDYKVTKKMAKGEKPDDNFKELYKERLMGPSMFVDATSPKATLGLIGSMADARINAAIDQKTGKFESHDMSSVRGKPLDRKRLANSTDTNFFINEILNKQECLPPWIESQQGTEREISAFRLDLQKKWFNLIMNKLTDQFHGLKADILSHLKEINLSINISTFQDDFNEKHSRYLTAKINDLNQGIRTYNLQCPSSSLHKWKLVKSTEMEKLYEQVMLNIKSLVEEWFQAQSKVRRIEPKHKGSSDSFLGVFDSAKGSLSFGSGSNYHIIERPQEQLNFWKLVKLIFKS